MVYSKRPGLDPERAEADTFDRSELYAPPDNVADAYAKKDYNPLNPMGCFQQGTTMMNQQHYLDPKYHGAGSTVAKMIHTKTGDKEMTKRILTVGLVGFFLLVLIVLSFAGTSERTKVQTLKDNVRSQVELIQASEDDFDPKLSHIAQLLRSPRTEYKHFDDIYGAGRAVQVIATSNGPRFQRNDIAQLLKHHEKEATITTFDKKYGKHAADKILSGHTGRDDKRKKQLQERLQKRDKGGELDMDVLDTVDYQIVKQKIKLANSQKVELQKEEQMTLQEEQAEVQESTNDGNDQTTPEVPGDAVETEAEAAAADAQAVETDETTADHEAAAADLATASEKAAKVATPAHAAAKVNPKRR